MAFSWIQVAKPPAPDEVEITLIGPGFGECILVHVGAGLWLIVDSCRDPESKDSAALLYLKSIGVDAAKAVKWIVATHWHADHVGGLFDLVSACAAARFYCASALSQKQFLIYAAQSKAVASGDTAEEFRNTLALLNDSKRPIHWTQAGRTLEAIAPLGGAPAIRLEALSPSDCEYTMFLKRIGALIATKGKPHRAPVASDPNHVAIVLAVRFGQDSILLGADLLAHPSSDRGWLAVVAESKVLGTPKADIVKIPHHGSAGAHAIEMWQELLVDKPVAAITPFSRGRKAGRPPKRSDLERISKLAGTTVLTAPTQSGRTRQARSPIALGLAQSGITMRTLSASIGLARFRRIGAAPWAVETFGRAEII
jgi:beta-lactamase superfamily II metal-dependent hydrolase